MKWSKDKPTTPGWYWHRKQYDTERASRFTEPAVALLWQFDKRLRVAEVSGRAFLDNKRFDGWEWSGPIPLPEEAT